MVRYLVLSSLLLCCGTVVAFDLDAQNDWGNVDQGLRVRIVGVLTEVDEQAPDWDSTPRNSDFETANDVTVLVQIKNVSEANVQLRGVRYGDNVSGSWSGRSNQSSFGPRCFSFQLYNETGAEVEIPVEKKEGPTYSDSAVEVLEVNEVLTMAITPLRWNPSVSASLDSGKYQLVVTYKGYGEKEWKGAASSSRHAISIRDAYRDRRHSLVWGPAKNGLRVAAEYRLADTRAEIATELRDRVFPIDSRVDVRFHFQNVSEEPIELPSDTWRQDDQVFHVTDLGEKRLTSTWYSGMTPRKTWMLQPKQIVVIPSIAMGFCCDLEQDDLAHPIGPVVQTESGDVRIRHDMQEGLSTGTTIITLRDRTPLDDPPTIDAFLKFKMPNGRFASEGFVKISTPSQRVPVFEGDISQETLTLESWRGGDLSVYVRVPGCQEETFRFVRPDQNPVIELSSSLVTKIRFLDGEGQPVAGVEVRHFAWTHVGSKGYPMPSKGLQGDVLGVSDSDGNLTLSSLNGRESQRQKIYTFYAVPSNGLAPTFIGPVPTGEPLSDIQLQPLVSISGVIKGTKQQLDNFAAEWDQPVALKLDDGSVSFQYAKSVRLEVTREADQITFRLNGLRPGKLRIVANFEERPHTTSYVSGRRDPKGSDELFEFDLDESRDDLVIQAGGK